MARAKKPEDFGNYYTLLVKDVAALMHIHIRTAHKLCKQDKFPVFRFRRIIRIPKQPFLDWLKTQKPLRKYARIVAKDPQEYRYISIKNGDFTKEQWVTMQAIHGHRCAYCKKKCQGKLTQDHLTPLSKGGKHTYANIVPACKRCNSVKHAGRVLCPVQPTLILS